MPGCAAIGCNNRSEKGYTMKCFPRDPKLRRIWKERVGRADWEPSNNSFLCHMHFEPHEWMVTQNGRIRLKRDASPSIFTITSTRKSPKKRRWEHVKQADDTYYVIEYLDNEVGYEQVILLDDGDKSRNEELDEESTCSLEPHMVEGYAQSIKSEGQNHNEVSHQMLAVGSMKDLEGDNVMIVTDNDKKEIGKLIRTGNNISMDVIGNQIIRPTTIDQDSQQQNAKAVLRNETDHAASFQVDTNHSYDEIEEKLKQICDGEGTSELPTMQKDTTESQLALRAQTIDGTDVDSAIQENNTEMCIERPNPSVEVHSKSMMKRNSLYSHSDEEIPRNVEIIFGSESDEDNRNASNSHALQDQKGSDCAHEQLKDENEQKTILTNGITDSKAGTLYFSEDIEANFSKDDVHVIPNIRAAMNRKKRIRDKDLKPAEETITHVGEVQVKQEFNDPILGEHDENTQGDDVCVNVNKESLEPLKSASELDSDRSMLKRTRFTIKVMGGSDDVTEIIQGLGPVERSGNGLSSKYMPGEKVNITSRDHRGNAFITSVIAVKDDSIAPLDLYHSPSDDGNYIVPEYMETKYEEDIKMQSPTPIRTIFKRNKSFMRAKQSNSKNPKLLRLSGTTEESKSKPLQMETDNMSGVPDSKAQMRITYPNNALSPHDQLQEKLSAQKYVIEKLTNQLLDQKDMQSIVTNLKSELQIKNREIEWLQNTVNHGQISKSDRLWAREDLDVKQKAIEGFSNNLKQVDETKKKQTKASKIESQESRKLKSQLKQKDDLIKELHWKIEKASKFLERAEKNANTYKRKMLSLQSLIRREKDKEEKRSFFKELMVDNAKHEFSDMTLLTAMDIRNSCGKEGYEKLLSYDFPLPSLRTLRRRFPKENATDDDWKVDATQGSSLGYQFQSVKMEFPEQSDTNETEVAGTVQDIFEESNDGDDPTSNELREHFFLQLNAAM